MAAPIRYSWLDANAPVARGERRSLCDILHACLVTGYGDKPPAGWTREYVNDTFDKAAFRNNPVTGTGFYLLVDGAGSTAAYRSIVKAYETMSSVNDGLFPFFTGSVPDVYLSGNPGTTIRPWYLEADDRAFYFHCWMLETAAPTLSTLSKCEFFFGDIVPWNPDDGFACALIPASSNYNCGLDLSYSSPSAASGKVYMPRALSGVASPISAAMVRGGGPGGDSYPGQAGPPYVAGGQMLITRPHINDAAGYTLRGWLPGFWSPCHSLTFGQLEIVAASGMEFLSVRGRLAGSSLDLNYFIALDDWWV